MKTTSHSLVKAIAGILFCLLLTATFSLTASAQSFSPGDDAKSVLEDKNVTVDYSTGLVHYSVPFSFFYSGEQTFPISFNYTSNTSHVGDNSGMLGIGWHLNYGGVVSRTVRGGIPDETLIYGIANRAQQYRDSATWDMVHSINKRIDGENDLFTVSVAGKSVNFFIKQAPGTNGQFEILPLSKSDLQIECLYHDSSTQDYYIEGWRVTDENGVQYTFTAKEWITGLYYQTESPINGFYGNNFISSWYLTEINVPGFSPISYEYDLSKCYSRIYESDEIDRNGENHLSSTKIRYNYSPLLPMYSYSHDYTEFVNEYRLALQTAFENISVESIKLQCERLITYDFTALRFGLMDMVIDYVRQQVSEYSRVLGILSDSRNVSVDMNENLEVLNTVLSNLYTLPPSPNTNTAISSVQHAKELLLESVTRADTLLSQTVRNGYSYTVYSPLPKRIISSDKLIVIHSRFSSTGSNVIDSLSEYDNYGTLLSRAVLHKSIGGASIETLDSLCFFNHDTLHDVIKFDYHHKAYAYYKNSIYDYDKWNQWIADEKSTSFDSTENYTTRFLLKSITNVYGARISLDYEKNEFSRPGAYTWQENGNRISMIRMLGSNGREDTISYSYPLPAVFDQRYITDNVTLNYTSISGAKDVLYFDKSQNSGFLLTSGGNNGLYYPYVVEHYHGNGYNSYLYSIPLPDIYESQTSLPHWNLSLPLAKAVYSEHGKLVSLHKRRYYSDTVPILQPTTYYDNYDFVQSLWYVLPPYPLSHHDTLYQVEKNPYFIDRDEYEARYATARTFPNGMSENDNYDYNILPRSYQRWHEQRYRIFYGGTVVPHSEERYIFPSTENSYGSGPRLSDLTGTIPQGALLQSRITYFYDNAPATATPTRILTENSNGVITEEHIYRADAYNEGIGTTDSLKQLNKRGAIVMRDVYRSDSSHLISRVRSINTFATYHDTVMLTDKVYKKLSKVTTIPAWNRQTALFPESLNGYRKESELRLDTFGGVLRKESSIALVDTTHYLYEKDSPKPILEIYNIDRSHFDALAPYKNNVAKLRIFNDSLYAERVKNFESIYYILQDFCNLHDATHNGEYSESYYEYTSDSSYLVCLDFSRRVVNHALLYDILPLVDSVYQSAIYLEQLYNFYEMELKDCGVTGHFDYLPFVLMYMCNELNIDSRPYTEISCDKYDTRTLLKVNATPNIRTFKLYSVIRANASGAKYKPKAYILKGGDTLSVNIGVTSVPSNKWILHTSTISLRSAYTPGDLCVDVSHDSVAVAYCVLVPMNAQFKGTVYHKDEKVACTLDHTGDMLFTHFDARGEIQKITDEKGRLLTQYEHSSLRMSDGYTKTFTNLLKSDTLTDFLTHIDYFDNQRNVTQSIDVNVHNNSDLVTVFDYGNFGRQEKIYAPFTKSANNGARIATPFEVINWGEYGYSEMSYMYSEKKYESSPLNRQIAEIGIGREWKTRNKRVTYQTSINTDTQIRHLVLTNNGGIKCIGNYPIGTLLSKRTVDEDGLSYSSFYNSNGEIIMSRKESVMQNIDLYYVYDSYDRVAWVITPEYRDSLVVGTTHSVVTLNKHAYRYVYDEYGRVVEKHFPSPESNAVYYIYDLNDRVVMSQDASMRAKDAHLWSYYQYDTYNRKTECGEIIVEYYTDRTAIASMVKSQGGALPSGVKEPLSYFLYDSYTATDNISPLPYVAVAGHDYQYSTNVVGKPTAAKYKVLGEDRWQTETMYYDAEGRLKQLVYENAMRGVSRNAYTYDESDRLILETEKHSALRPIVAPRVDIYREYSPWGRLNSIEYRLDSVSVSTTEYKYNALGEEKNRIHNTGTNKLTDTYTYNAKGWLKSKSNKYFNLTLYYNDPVAKSGNVRYNGNISEVSWRHGSDTTKLYSFAYDRHGRLNNSDLFVKEGTTWRLSTNSNTERNIQYDLNSNILSLSRTSQGELVDSLEYSYAGDRLISLREHVTNISDSDVYKSNGMQESHFTYDANGNMLTDTRRGMRVEYNTLNLPAKVWRNDTLIATYSYLADGTKLSVNPVGGDTLVYVGSLLTRRNGYGWEPELVLTQEGQVEYKNMNSYENKVFIRDNMGSVRAVWNGTLDSLETVMDYYPFGAEHQNPVRSTQPKPRYRYSGKEDQLEAMNGILDFGSRYYNPQIGRWLHSDPQAESYYQYSPYSYCANNPTNLIDPDGEEIFATSIVSNNYNSLFATYEWTYEYGAWQFIDISTHEPYGNNGYTSVFMNELKYTLETIMSRPFGYSYINDIVTLEEIVVINHSNLNNSNSYKEAFGIYMLNNVTYSNIIGVINWYNPNNINEQNFKNFEISTIEGYQINPTTSLIHELAHFYYDAMGGDMNDIWFTIDVVDKYTNTAPKNIYISEIYTTHIENIVRNEQGFPLRDQYLNDRLNVFGDIDKIINVKNKTSIFFRDGYGLDLIPQNILNSKKGYKYE